MLCHILSEIKVVWFVRCSGLALIHSVESLQIIISVLGFLTSPRAEQCMGFSCLDPSFSAECPFSLPGPSPISTTQHRTSC